MRTTRNSVAGLALCLCALGAPLTHAQVCGRWVANPAPGVRPPTASDFNPPTAPGVVDAAAAWDPDGDGPALELLVCSGPFAFAGDQRVEGWASFDGSAWHPFSPMPEGGGAHFLAVEGSKLFAGVGSDLLRLDAGWTKIGTATALLNETHPFRTSAIIAGRMWVGGAFSAIDGQPAAGLAEWDGHAWRQVGEGFEPYSCVQTILSRSDGVYVGGYRRRGTAPAAISDAFVARWDGASWHDLNVGSAPWSTAVNTLVEADGAILAGGWFAGENGSLFGAVRQWDGQTWTTTFSSPAVPVGTITVAGGSVTAFPLGAAYSTIINRKANYAIAYQRVGGQWVRLGDSSNGSARGVVTFGGNQIAFGTFNGAVNFGFARWDGHDWRNLNDGLSHPVAALGVWNDHLVAVGSDVSVLEDDRWVRLPPIGGYGSVTAVGSFNGDLLVAAARGATSMFRWADGAWSPIVGQVTPPSSYTGSTITCMREFNGSLYVAGNLLGVGSITSSGLVAWNGTEWSGVGGLVATGSITVAALFEYEGKLLVGGSFKRAGDVEVQNVAAWDGHTWSDMGGGLPVQRVTDFALHNGTLYAAAAGSSILWRWTGDTWEPVLAADAPFHGAYRIRSVGGRLLAHDGIQGVYVYDDDHEQEARYVGIFPSKTMEAMDGRLFCAGGDTRAIDGGAWASFLAELRPENNPPVLGQFTAPPTVREGPGLTLSCPVWGATPITPRWFRNGTEIATTSQYTTGNYTSFWSPPNPYTGAPGQVQLTLRTVRALDAGEYTLEVTNPCGTTTGGPIALDVTCGADFNGDGAATVADVFSFLDAWFHWQTSANIDGQYGCYVGDLFTFLNFYFEGCG